MEIQFRGAGRNVLEHRLPQLSRTMARIIGGLIGEDQRAGQFIAELGKTTLDAAGDLEIAAASVQDGTHETNESVAGDPGQCQRGQQPQPEFSPAKQIVAGAHGDRGRQHADAEPSQSMQQQAAVSRLLDVMDALAEGGHFGGSFRQ